LNQHPSSNCIKQKVYAYILADVGGQKRLLVFKYVHCPEAGTQVPGGSVEPGESISTAVMREAQEETGLTHLHLIKKLGVVRRDMADFGLAEVQERHYFLLRCTDYPGDTWVAYEETPSDGTQGPKPFRFFWVERDQVPVLAGGMDEMLPNITWD
jgi:8-oxo-dGTP pyrophosphatase MutT (NUDIX family)